ncbi:MAG: SPOR domain-containing protein [Sphingomonas sp.]|uniref:SPOR domain-containing protein n=1 Tax=Sphingomonas sp. TaxID=28214 RepID=UPI001B127788|nr:SPOR domain-containing protein [Sphingomonas sp.]MBO9624608.1 SPOR domain-containing protein [Sphingomonas sp.]
MSVRAGDGYGDDDRLPWLETVEEEYREGLPLGRIALFAALLLLVLAAGAGGYYWYSQHQGLQGNGELIEPEPGDYKVKPDEPGGMKVEGEGDTLFATSQGASSNASINVGALPEAPVEGRRAAEAGQAVPGSRVAKIAVPGAKLVERRPAAASAAAAAAPPAGSGSLIQLGAYPDEGGANIAWTRLSKRFAYLAPLGKSVERAEKDGKAIFRLRVNAGSNTQARELCGRLKVAGENCFVAN